MTVKISSVGAILGLMCILISPCYATSHAYVLSDKGEVWLVSDTLEVHTERSMLFDGLFQTKVTVCKVIVERGRLMFNTGSFSDLSQLESEESTLPLSDFETTEKRIEPLLLKYRMVALDSGEPMGWQSAGWVQVSRGVYSGGMVNFQFTRTAKPGILHEGGDTRPILHLIPGVPQGFGPLVDTMHHKTYYDHELSKRISEHPRAALLKILQQEAIENPDSIGPPYTIFLLHKDGTVSDYSKTPVCKIPADAARATP